MLMALFPGTARGDPPTWNTSANGLWFTGTNWSTLTAPNGIDAQAVLGLVATNALTVTLDSPVTLGQLTLTSTGLGTYTLTGSQLTLRGWCRRKR